MIHTYENATIMIGGRPLTKATVSFDEGVPVDEPEQRHKPLDFSVTISFTVKATRSMRRFFDSFAQSKDTRRTRRERRHFERPPTRGYWKGCRCQGCQARAAVDAVRPAHVPPWEALSRLAVGLPADGREA